MAAPKVDQAKIREAVLALEAIVIEDLRLPLPSDLKDISKAAALVSGVVEDRIPELLNRVRTTTWDEDGKLGAYEFRKEPIGFPDILLVERSKPENVIFEVEAKSWYILSGDTLTARFETARSVITPGTLVIIAAWMLDSVVAGSPKIMRLHIDDAQRLAKERDAKWEAIDSEHRVVQPTNAPGVARNLRETQVRGEVEKNGRWVKDADNFGKLDRLYDPAIQQFRDEVLGLKAAGKSLADWRNFIKR